MADTEHGRGDESAESMVGSDVTAQREDASLLADKGEEKREDYGSTGDNEEQSTPDTDRG